MAEKLTKSKPAYMSNLAEVSSNCLDMRVSKLDISKEFCFFWSAHAWLKLRHSHMWVTLQYFSDFLYIWVNLISHKPYIVNWKPPQGLEPLTTRFFVVLSPSVTNSSAFSLDSNLNIYKNRPPSSVERSSWACAPTWTCSEPVCRGK